MINKRIKLTAVCILVLLTFILCGCNAEVIHNADSITWNRNNLFDISTVPEYSGAPYVELNGNVPYFKKEEFNTDKSFEEYSQLDYLSRCGSACGNISLDIMPQDKRESIGSVKPSGWHTVRYDDIVEGKYLYNRCHLIAYMLAGENANEKNLITGTRYLNTEGMLPFEKAVEKYIEKTGNHVLYRVTPVFKSDNLVASGVVMEALSVEDDGAGVQFNIYAYNVQPGIIIDYGTGESRRDIDKERLTLDNESKIKSSQDYVGAYVINTNTHKFHYPTCGSVADINEKNMRILQNSRDEIMQMGFSPCKRCNP